MSARADLSGKRAREHGVSRPSNLICAAFMAERVGFEPTVPAKGTTVFETAPFDHSGTSPQWGPSAGRDAKRAPTQPGRSNPRH